LAKKRATPKRDITAITNLLISGQVWKVIWNDDGFENYSEHVWGHCRSESQEIHIASGLSEDMLFITLLHEMVHASLIGRRLLTEEDVCDFLPEAMISFLRLNPQLAQFL